MRVPYVDIGGQYKEQRTELLGIIDKLLESGQYILGSEVEKFEKAFAARCDADHAVAVANGTDALILTLKALNVGPDDEVITVPNSWISSASSIALMGAKPVFVDVLKDQTLDPSKLKDAMTSKTKAIIPVHLTGKCADMNPILEIAKTKNIPVIEDSAQAVGATYFGKTAGSMGAASCFSLHPLKNLNACGDAGIITTNDSKLAEQLRLLRHHGLIDRNTAVRWGYNSRLDSLQAALLNFRLSKLSNITEKRRENAEFYRREIGHLVECPIDRDFCQDVYHLFVIQVDKRDALRAYLAERGIETAIHYPLPIHLQPCAQYLGHGPGSFPEAERQANRILSIPIHQALSTAQLNHVAQTIRAFYS